MGNLRSVKQALAAVGCDAIVQSNLSGASRLIIPGVGAFGAAMERLAPLAPEIRKAAADGMPILGLCLGQQLLFESSEERGSYTGLGLLAGYVSYLPPAPEIKIPHMGWNGLHYVRSEGPTAGGKEGEQVYFVHSLVTVCADPEDVVATATHGIEFAAAVGRNNVWGCQFHPEKKRRDRPSYASAVRRVLIIPAIDLRAGNAVRLAQGDFHRETIYDTDPVSVAGGFIDSGARWLHVVDLDGAKTGEPHHWKVVENIVKLGVPVQFGGGIRALETAQRVLELGVARIVVGTRVVTDPWFAARLFADYGERVAAGIDAREGNAAAAGWELDSLQKAEQVAAKAAQDGCRRIILTDIARDGMQSGPNTELLGLVKRASNLPVIHSGGIGSLEHLQTLTALGKDAPEGVIIGRALYEGTFTLESALVVGEGSGL